MPPGRRPAATRRPASPAAPAEPGPDALPEAPSMTGPRRFPRLPAVRTDRLGGPWRIAVVEGSMLPAIESGDWLLVDPTVARWPRRGSVVVFREPGSGLLAIKRVVARPGDWVRFADGWLRMGDDEAWLLGDAPDEALAAAGHGPAVD